MTEDWFDVLVALLGAETRFLVVGAHAMAIHGVLRGTQDLDIWVEPSNANAQKVWQALTAFGAPLESMGIDAADFARPDTVVQIGLPPNRIDILTAITGVSDFETAWNDRAVHTIRERPIPFLGRRTLVQNKRAVGRPKDLADLDALGDAP